jgi:hypothetical protein
MGRGRGGGLLPPQEYPPVAAYELEHGKTVSQA